MGLEKRIAGIIAMPGEDQYLLPEYADKIKNIPVIMCADLYVPSGEELDALKPDFVVLSFYYRDYMDRLGISADNIPFYIFDGSVPGKANLETVYKDIFNLGQIFHVEDKANALVSRIRDALFALPLRPFKKRNPRIFVYDSGKDAPFTAFADTLENDLIRIAGGENVFTKKHGTYGEISWKEAAETNPDFIIIHDYIDYMSVNEKIEAIKSVPEFRDCTAIKENRFITLTLSQVFPGIQNSHAVKKMCMDFYKNRF